MSHKARRPTPAGFFCASVTLDSIMRMQTPAKFKVTRFFTAGLLAGLTHTETTAMKFHEGFVCAKPAGGDPYKITHV